MYGLQIFNGNNSIIINSDEASNHSVLQDSGVTLNTGAGISLGEPTGGPFYYQATAQITPFQSGSVVFARPNSTTAVNFLGYFNEVGNVVVISNSPASFNLKVYLPGVSVTNRPDYGLEVRGVLGNVIYHSGSAAARIKGLVTRSGSVSGQAGKLYGLLVFQVRSVTPGVFEPGDTIMSVYSGSSTGTSMSFGQDVVFDGYNYTGDLELYDPNDYRYTNPTIPRGLIMECPA